MDQFCIEFFPLDRENDPEIINLEVTAVCPAPWHFLTEKKKRRERHFKKIQQL